MAYDSPRTLRRRQLNAENKPTRRARQPREIRVMTDEEWEEIRALKIISVEYWILANRPESAGRHARAIVTMAVQRRATQLMRDFDLLSVWKAMDVARHELFNCEIA